MAINTTPLSLRGRSFDWKSWDSCAVDGRRRGFFGVLSGVGALGGPGSGERRVIRSNPAIGAFSISGWYGIETDRWWFDDSAVNSSDCCSEWNSSSDLDWASSQCSKREMELARLRAGW